MSKYQGFEDFKIIKKCESNEKIKEVKIESCESFKIPDGNFIEKANDEILYVDDKIKLENEREKVTGSVEKDKKVLTNIQPPECFSELPAKLKHQISLPIDNIEKLSFYETFIISKDPSHDLGTRSCYPIIPDIQSINEIGSSSIVVEEMDDGNILIFVTQQMFENGERTVLEILSVITKNLNLVHEKIIERKCSEKYLNERSLHIIATDSGMTLIKSQTTDGRNTEQLKGNVNWTKKGNFLSKGANVMILRKLVDEKFVGCVHAYCCNLDGEFAVSQHIFNEVEKSKVFEKCMQVQRIDQILIFDNGRVEKNSYFYSPESGRMLKQIWTEDLNQIHINPLSDLPPKNFNKTLHENWQDDLELMTMYLEYKAKRKEELKTKFNSPCVKSALHDYINSLIKCKPKSIMNFTMEFMRKLEQGGNVQLLKTFERRIQQNI